MASSEEQQLPRGFRGYAALITNKQFHLRYLTDDEDPTRKGADEDDTNFQYIFNTKLGFELLDKKTYKNVDKVPYADNDSVPHWIHASPCPGHDSLLPNERCPCPCISCKIQTTDHSKSECFVLAISTHGALQEDGEQVIFFCDDYDNDRVKLSSYGAKRVKLSEIIETLNDKNCKTLKGKTRIILLQLCRSNPDVPEDKQDEVWHDKGHIIPPEHRSENLTIGERRASDFGAINGDTGESQDMEDTDVIELDPGVDANDLKPKMTGNVEAEKDDTNATQGSNDTAEPQGMENTVPDDPKKKAESNVEAEKDDTNATQGSNDTAEPQGMEYTVPDDPKKKAESNVKAEKDDTNATQGSNDTAEPQGMEYTVPDDPKKKAESNVEAEKDDTSATQEFFNGTEKALRSLPSDFLVIFPTVYGKVTWHDAKHGSWLIQELRDVVENFEFKQTPDMNFLTVLTKTADNVARKKESKEGYKCAVCIVHRLLRPLIFRDIREISQEQPNLAADIPALHEITNRSGKLKTE